jgi:hypothetical protein
MTRMRALQPGVYARMSQEWGACLVNSRNARKLAFSEDHHR